VHLHSPSAPLCNVGGFTRSTARVARFRASRRSRSSSGSGGSASTQPSGDSSPRRFSTGTGTHSARRRPPCRGDSGSTRALPRRGSRRPTVSPGRLRLDDLAREFARLSHEDRPEEGGAGVKQKPRTATRHSDCFPWPEPDSAQDPRLASSSHRLTVRLSRRRRLSEHVASSTQSRPETRRIRWGRARDRATLRFRGSAATGAAS
jgi:hypothetical protein